MRNLKFLFTPAIKWRITRETGKFARFICNLLKAFLQMCFRPGIRRGTGAVAAQSSGACAVMEGKITFIADPDYGY